MGFLTMIISNYMGDAGSYLQHAAGVCEGQRHRAARMGVRLAVSMEVSEYMCTLMSAGPPGRRTRWPHR